MGGICGTRLTVLARPMTEGRVNVQNLRTEYSPVQADVTINGCLSKLASVTRNVSRGNVICSVYM